MAIRWESQGGHRWHTCATGHHARGHSSCKVPENKAWRGKTTRHPFPNDASGGENTIDFSEHALKERDRFDRVGVGEVIVGTGGGRVVVSKKAIVYKEELTIASGDASPPPSPQQERRGGGLLLKGGGGLLLPWGGGGLLFSLWGGVMSPEGEWKFVGLAMKEVRSCAWRCWTCKFGARRQHTTEARHEQGDTAMCVDNKVMWKSKVWEKILEGNICKENIRTEWCGEQVFGENTCKQTSGEDIAAENICKETTHADKFPEKKSLKKH